MPAPDNHSHSLSDTVTYTPSSIVELRSRLRQLSSEHLRVVGAAERLHPDQLEGQTVIKTERCNSLIDVDRESQIIRVEAGMTWRQLKTTARQNQLTVRQLGLQPDNATVGGLLARTPDSAPEYLCGDIRHACIGLRGICREGDDYLYKTAPRKSSGPDLRYRFIGQSDVNGAIAEVGLGLSRQLPTRAFRWQADHLREASESYKGLRRLGVRPTWTFWSTERSAFIAAICGPTRFLQSIQGHIREKIQPPPECLKTSHTDKLRDNLEANLPTQRSVHGDSLDRLNLLSGTVSRSNLGKVISEVDPESVTIFNWQPRRCRVIVETADNECGPLQPVFESARQR